MEKKGMSVKISEYINSEGRKKIPNLHGLKLIVGFVIMNAISTHFLFQTIRSIRIAPNVFNELIPFLIPLLATPFVMMILSMFLDSTFLGLLGCLLQVLGKTLSLIPSDPDYIIYNTWMAISFIGQGFTFYGMLGFLMKDVKIKNFPEGTGKMKEYFTFGLFLGVALNLILRAIELNEGIVTNIILILVFSSTAVIWYQGVDKKHCILKNLDQTREYNRGKGKKFSKALNLFTIGPIIGIFSFHYNKPELVSAVSLVDYSTTVYWIILGLLVSPLIHHLLRNVDEKVMNFLRFIMSVTTFLVFGLMYYVPRGVYLLVFIVILPFAMCFLIDGALTIARNVKVNNVDIAIILTYIIVILSIIVTVALAIYFFVPYVQLILSAILLTYEVMHFLKKQPRRGK
ncbi:MAG: hypothetical protein ACFFCS_18960 [Candidatus Hodarchaeota archaeon]